MDVLHRQPFGAGIFDRLAAVDTTIRYEPHGAHRGLWGRLRLFRTLRARRYDAAIFLYSSPSPFWAAFLARVPLRISRHTANRSGVYPGSYLCNCVVRQDRNRAERHEVEYNMDMLAPLGIAPVRTAPLLPVSGAEEAEVAALLLGSGVGPAERVAVIHPGASERRVRWPAASYAAVGDALSQRGAAVVLTGGPADGSLGARTAAAMRRPAVDLSHRLSLPHLCALMKRAALYVGVDSGPMHIAAAFGTPVALLLPQFQHRAVYRRWYPYGSDHIPVPASVTCEGCVAGRCLPRAPGERTPCATAILLGEVAEAAVALLEGSPHPRIVRWHEPTLPQPPLSAASTAR